MYNGLVIDVIKVGFGICWVKDEGVFNVFILVWVGCCLVVFDCDWRS